jgi:ABC-type uncharacterized transport system permease subunit
MNTLNVALVLLSAVVLTVGLVMSVVCLRRVERDCGNRAWLVNMAGLLLLVTYFLVSGLIRREVPLSSMRDSILFFVLVLLVTNAVASRLSASGFVSVVLVPLAIVLEVMALFSSRWLQTGAAQQFVGRTFVVAHVVMFLASYALFLLAGAFGVMFLLLDRVLKSKSRQPLSFGLPGLERLDIYMRRSMLFGLLGLTLAIGLSLLSVHRLQVTGVAVAGRGGVSADLTIMSAMVLWVYYFLYLALHARLGWVGKRASYVSLCGVVLLLVLYMAVKMLPVGGALHGFEPPVVGVAP